MTRYYMENREKNDLSLDYCTNCTACENSCPVGAISMIPDNKGFLSASIDKDRCIMCKKCINVCPHLNHKSGEKYKEVYLYKTNSEEIYRTSSSGGAAADLYSYYLNKEISVYGVIFDSNLTPIYSKASSNKEARLFRGSKYIQADMGDKFSEVKKSLGKGEKVFFVGLPCTIAGLKRFLIRENVCLDDLLTCDLVCNGVGSPGVWKSYCKYLSKRYGVDPCDYHFREKYVRDKFAPGNNTHHTFLRFSNGNELSDEKLDAHLYQNLYFKKIIMNDACYNCHFSKNERQGDLTLADNTGYTEKEGENYKFSSLVLVNNEKGIEMLDVLRRFGVLKQIDINEVNLPRLSESAIMPRETETFWKLYHMFGFGMVAAIFGGKNPVSMIKRLKNKIKV